VFSVSAASTGSRVSVIEGEVRLQKGQTEQTLQSGQQASTSLSLGPMSVESEIGWSKSAGKLVALLQQAPPSVPAPPRREGTNVVTGVVRRSNNGEPISGLAVSLCVPESDKEGKVVIGDQTNGDVVGENQTKLVFSDKNVWDKNSLLGWSRTETGQ
jgi:hypothetical protein